MLKAIHAGSVLEVIGSLFQVLGPTSDRLCIHNFDLRKGNFNFLLRQRVATPLLSMWQKTPLK